MTEQAVLWEAGTRPRRRNTISTTSSGVDNNILNRIEIGGETDALTACHVNTDNKEGESSYHYAEEPFKLPPSTHSLLFIEPIYSLPFFMSVLTAAICYASLILALIYNVSNGEVPPNVETSVRIAQYLAVGIAMVMEDEVPIGIYLLRRLPKAYLRTKFPDIRYWRFVASNVMRISLGYLFLINVLYIVLIADDVLAIFYDVLALQFCLHLDDICFQIAKYDAIGRRMQIATTRKYFKEDIHDYKEKSKRGRGLRFFLKSLNFFDAVVMLTPMAIVSYRQQSGYYQCTEISVTFGSEIYRDAIIKWPDSSVQYAPGSFDKMVLAYSYFNGVYMKDLNKTNDGRPIYFELKKSDRTPFDDQGPSYNPYNLGWWRFDAVRPAQFMYCDGRWIFTHPYVFKSRNEETKCQWLARSEETSSFDLLSVIRNGKWEVWQGTIQDTRLSAKCNTCEDDATCNLNGICNKDGMCDCNVEDSVYHLGVHCQVRVKSECRTIIGEKYGDIWSNEIKPWVAGSNLTIDQEYDRPIYTYVEGLPDNQSPMEGANFVMLYSGSRWFVINLVGALDEEALVYWRWQSQNFHGLWTRAFEDNGIAMQVSEPTYGSVPTETDFFYLGRRNSQFGPYGELIPAQVNNQTGNGLYRCKDRTCPYCKSARLRPGIWGNQANVTVPSDFYISKYAGLSCDYFSELAKITDEGSMECQGIQSVAKMLCCPGGT